MVRHPVRGVPPEPHRPTSAQTASGSALRARSPSDSGIYLTVCTAAQRRSSILIVLGIAASTKKPGAREWPGSQTGQGGL